FSGSNISLSGDITGGNAKFSKAAFGGAEPTNEYNILAPGNSRFGTATFDGPVTFLGTVTEAEEREFTTSERYFTINNNEAGSGITGGSAGMYVKRGSQPNFEVGFYEDTQTYRIGLLGDLQAVATRQDSPLSNGMPFWNSTAKRFDTAAGLSFSAGVLNAPGKIKAGGEISTGAFSVKLNDVGTPLDAGAVDLGLIIKGNNEHSLLFKSISTGVYGFTLSDHLNLANTKGIYQNNVVRLDGSGNATLATITSSTGNFSVSGSTNMFLNTGGDIVFNNTGNDILPFDKYAKNLGSAQYKFLTLHAAELWVETLVASEVRATVGGRLLTGPTTELVADLAPGDTTIKVKHNNLNLNQILQMEGGGNVEFMRVSSAYTPIPGGYYQYTVARNLDATGANQWYAGAAVFNTGGIGDGFIDQYSISGMKSSNQKGPTIVGNIRNSLTYNDWTEYWAIGNLEGLYGYAAKTMGVALGKYIPATGQATQNGSYWTIDSTNGIRLNLVKAGVQRVGIQADNNGNMTLPGLDVGAIQGADWNTNLTNIPAILGVPSGKGLFLSSTYFGYYDTNSWKSAFKSDGSGLLAGGNIHWNTAGDVTVKGYLFATSGGFGNTADEPIISIGGYGFSFVNRPAQAAQALSSNSILIGKITGSANSAIKLTKTESNSTSGLFGYTSAGTEAFALRLDGTTNIAGFTFNERRFAAPNVTSGTHTHSLSIDAYSSSTVPSIGVHLDFNTELPVGEGRKYLSFGTIKKTSMTAGAYTFGIAFYNENTPYFLLSESTQRIGGFNFTGNEFTAIGDTTAITGGILRTAASGERVELNGND
ncbi:MAG TPA: hypothetical protein VHP30_11230, partial [Ignavibacteriales bacterium]|nr:hypothetical protein [Ignavibacteriales bacterium]